MGIGATALSLIGCGGSSDTGGSGSDLLYEPADAGNSAARGGIYPTSENTEPQSFDMRAGIDMQQSLHAYSRLVQYETYKYPETAMPTVKPDAALSWDVSPDGMTYTFKLRPNFKYDPRPPTSGRPMTSADVKWSWDRLVSVNPMGATLANSKSPGAPVVNVETPDASTVVMKLAFPYSDLLSMLAFYRHMPIMPLDAETAYNIRSETRGTGPWRLKQHRQSVSLEYERNPDWYDAAKVNFDGLMYYILAEYTAGLSQFRAGNLATYEVSQEDILPTKAALPQLRMLADTDFSRGPDYLRFGYLPGSPFFDDRVRKAVSVLIDRDLFIETFGNTKDFEDAGLEVATRWHTAITAGDEGFWLDPEGHQDLRRARQVVPLRPGRGQEADVGGGTSCGI